MRIRRCRTQNRLLPSFDFSLTLLVPELFECVRNIIELEDSTASDETYGSLMLHSDINNQGRIMQIKIVKLERKVYFMRALTISKSIIIEFLIIREWIKSLFNAHSVWSRTDKFSLYTVNHRLVFAHNNETMRLGCLTTEMSSTGHYGRENRRVPFLVIPSVELAIERWGSLRR